MKPLISILALVLLCSGCAYVRVYDHNSHSGFSSMMPAYPWQDSTQIINRMNLSVKTNGAFTASIRDLNAAEVTSSNSVHLIEAASRGAIEGAIKALGKP